MARVTTVKQTYVYLILTAAEVSCVCEALHFVNTADARKAKTLVNVAGDAVTVVLDNRMRDTIIDAIGKWARSTWDDNIRSRIQHALDVEQVLVATVPLEEQSCT